MALIAKAADVCHCCLISAISYILTMSILASFLHYDVHISLVFRSHSLMTVLTYCLNFNVIQNKSVCLVNYQITVNSYVTLFNCTPINQATYFIIDMKL